MANHERREGPRHSGRNLAGHQSGPRSGVSGIARWLLPGPTPGRAPGEAKPRSVGATDGHANLGLGEGPPEADREMAQPNLGAGHGRARRDLGEHQRSPDAWTP